MAAQPQVEVRRTYRFAAAHHYYDPSRSEEENFDRFGKCANRHGHGHNYRFDVVLCGAIDPGTGMLMDLRELDTIVSATVLDQLDHRNLNLEVPHFGANLPTCENLALFVWHELAPRIPHGLLGSVRVYECDDLSAEYRGLSHEREPRPSATGSRP